MSNVWCADDTFLGDLIFLNRDNLIVDSPAEDKMPGIRDALLGGEAPASVLSSDAVNIPLLAVTKISTDRNDSDIEIEYRDGKETEERTLRLASPEKRDEVFGALKAVYGAKFEEFEEAYSVPQAVVGPLMSLTIFGCLTWLFANAAAEIRAAEEIEISGSKQGLKALFVWVLDFLGPIGVSVIGGLICLLCAMAIFNGIKEPPVMATLQEPPYKKQSLVKLVFKYGIIAVIWYFALKLLLI